MLVLSISSNPLSASAFAMDTINGNIKMAKRRAQWRCHGVCVAWRYPITSGPANEMTTATRRQWPNRPALWRVARALDHSARCRINRFKL